MRQDANALSQNASALTSGNDGACSFLNNYRMGAHGQGGAGLSRPGGCSGRPAATSLQGAGRGAALTDKYGNLI